ncbi:MAG: HlyD family efflux transporter periplasmic adaptor subunit [Phycisphaerae bacterium]|nr:HlyD family efflux transporter periplasmic adaptor subunit [Phycisphaerae bacterium]
MTDAALEKTSGRPAEDFARATDLFSRVRQVAAHESSASSFVGEAFRMIARELRAPFALLRARVAGRSLEDYWHTGATDPAFWRTTVERTLDESIARASAVARLYRAKDGDATVSLIACPLPEASGEVNGAIALVLECRDEKQAHELLSLVRGVTAMMPALAASITREATREQQATTAGGGVVQALAAASGAKSRVALAMSITNQLRAKIGCEQVILADVRRNRPRLVSISGFAEVPERAPGVTVALDAMCEALDAKRPVCWNGADQANRYALHQKWSNEVDGAAVATIPLMSGDTVSALLAIRHAPGRRFTEEDLKKIADAALPYASALQLVHRATRTAKQHFAESLSHAMTNAFRPRSLPRTLAWLAGIAACVWFMFGTVQDTATVRCRLASAGASHLAMPFEGALVSAPVVAGDAVKAGQVLATIDTSDLEIERTRLDAAIARARIEADAARGAGKTSEAALIDARAAVDEASLEGIRRKLARSTIVAPADGVVLSGDLRSRVGSTLPAGETLFQFAPTGALRVEIAIPDRDVHRMQSGARGTFASLAKPDVRIPITIERIRAGAELRDGENVFVAEAELEADAPWLRSGSEGFARIETGTAAPWQAWLRRAIDFVRIKLWV